MEKLFPQYKEVFLALTNWFVAETLIFFLIIILLLFFTEPRWNRILGALHRVNNQVCHLSEKRYLPLLITGFYALSWCLFLYQVQKPLPRVPDEFGYLLGADTFLNGNVTNPTHPMWQHFESIQVLQKPFYMPRYPPGKSIVIALGKLITGQWIAGVFMSYILGAVATCWMLQAWLSRYWAFMGGLAVATYGHIMLEWGMGFWGGALSMLGGALIFGALPRLMKSVKVRYAVLLGVGLVILAYTRPYEGLVAALTLIIPVGIWVKEKVRVHSPDFRKLFLVKFLMPVAFLLLVGMSWLGYYNYRNTGNLLVMPYTLYDPQYETARAFLFQQPHKTPEYRHPEIAAFHNHEAEKFERRRTFTGFLEGVLFKLWDYWRFFISITFSVPLVLFLRKGKSFWEKYALATVSLIFLTNTITTWEDSHYFAPITCLIVFMVIQGFREIYLMERVRLRFKRVISSAIVLTFLCSPFMAAASHWKILNQSFAVQRHQHIEALKQKEGKHLVIVHYGPRHSATSEWVYNRANIDSAKVVWAKDMGKEENRDLINYFNNRTIWKINVDQNAEKLILVKPGKSKAAGP